jgi:signal transduction histidine kinase
VPEVDAIARGLDSSAERIAELVAREREFSANVSHQLRTPLTALRLRLEEGELEEALSETDRLEATIADLLAHARLASAGNAVTVNLGTVAHEHAARWKPVFADARRVVEVSADKNVLARASRGTVGQVLDVLLENALHHGAGPARITVRGDGRTARIEVADGGPGVAAADRDRIFERGASRGGGTGIGLHLARTLAQADRGSLRVLQGEPTRFELRLPRLAA